MQIGTVIVTRGDPQLEATVNSIIQSCPTSRICVVDDSDNGLPVNLAGKAEIIAPGVRLGCSRGRYVGSQHFLSMNGSAPAGVVFTDDHMAFMPDDPRVPAEWRTGSYSPTPGGFDRLAEIGISMNCIAYGSCNGHSSATLGIKPGFHSVPRCTWNKHYDVPTPTKGMMGAMYLVPITVLDLMGGWPALAGWIGWDEEMVSLISWRMGIPIVYVPGVMSWHDFGGSAKRNETYRYDRYQVALASMWRLLLDDAHWPTMRKHLASTLMLECTNVSLPEYVLAEVESPEMVVYARSLHVKFLQSDEAFIKEWQLPF